MPRRTFVIRSPQGQGLAAAAISDGWGARLLGDNPSHKHRLLSITPTIEEAVSAYQTEKLELGLLQGGRLETRQRSPDPFSPRC